ncbi:MAG TPA: LPS export ABC transporter periplasmic protein LptC [Gammaproteobacteria bacterium]
MRSWRTLLVALLFGLVVAYSAWLQELDAPLAREERAGDTPDHVLEGYRVAQYAPDGSPRYRLTGPQLRHFPGDERTELEAPELTLYDAAGPAWSALAERGELSAGAERVLLGGAVTLQRLPGAQRSALTVETRDLRLEPEADLAETDQPVRITGPRYVVDAVGLRAAGRRPARDRTVEPGEGAP